jgi:Protein of unknown function (DUF1161)
MKMWTLAAALVLACTYSGAQTAQPTRKPCDDLKAEIAKKLGAKNVTDYSLEIVDKGKEGDGKVVGTCDGGTKSIVYSKTKPSQTAAPAEKKAQ